MAASLWALIEEKGQRQALETQAWRPIMGADAAMASLVSTKSSCQGQWGAFWHILVALEAAKRWKSVSRRSLGPMFNEFLFPAKTSTASSALGHDGHGSRLGFNEMEPNRLMTCRPGLLA